MQHLLKDKVALVTGGTAGIGRGIAHLFASEGASVIIFGTNEKRAQEVLTELKALSSSSEQTFHSELVNVANHADSAAAIERLYKIFGKVDILVNNAGITRDGLLMKMSEEDWDVVLDTNLKSVYNLCHALIRPMMKARTGKIINITSIIGLTGNPGQVNYAASKAGMIGFTKALAQEVGSRGICVNAIAPGFIETRMTEGLTEDGKALYLKSIPLGRFGLPEDIAKAALFFASNWSDYITGQVLTVDGGMVM